MGTKLIYILLLLPIVCYSQLITENEIEVSDSSRGDDLRPNQIGVYSMKTNTTSITFSDLAAPGYGDDVAFDPAVVGYNHTTQSLNAKVYAGTNDQDDSHNYPKMALTNDGRRWVAFGAHNSNVQIGLETYPGSGVFDSLDVSAPDGSYPVPITSRLTGKNIMFYRISDDFGGGSFDPHRPLGMKYTYDFQTWTETDTIIDRAPLGGGSPDSDPDTLHEIYLGGVFVEYIPEDTTEFIWMCWTLAGGLSHDDYHGNVYVAKLNTLNMHFYDVDGNDLGTTIEGVYEMDSTNKILAYASPRPVTGFTTGYINNVSIGGDNKYPIVYRTYNTAWKYNGTSWNEEATSGIGNNSIRSGWSQIDVYDSVWHYCGLSVSTIYRSYDGTNFELVANNTSVSGYGQAIPVENPIHIGGMYMSKEGDKGVENNLVHLTGEDNPTISANQLWVETDTVRLNKCDTVKIYAYAVENKWGFQSRDLTYSTDITLACDSGQIISSTISPSSGVSEFQYVTHDSGMAMLTATSGGLDQGYVWIESLGGEATCEASEPPSSNGTVERLKYNRTFIRYNGQTVVY